MLTYIQDLATRTAQGQPQQPAIDVPVQVVPDPVEVFGTLEMRIVFPHNAISGIPYEQLVEKVFTVMNGGRGFDLPEVYFGTLKLRREVHESATTQNAGTTANVSGGVPQTRHPIDGEHAGDSPVGAIRIGDEAVEGGIADQSHGIRPSADFLGSLLQAARTGGAGGTRSDEPDSGGESGISGFEWAAAESAGEEEDEEES